MLIKLTTFLSFEVLLKSDACMVIKVRNFLCKYMVLVVFPLHYILGVCLKVDIQVDKAFRRRIPKKILWRPVRVAVLIHKPHNLVLLLLAEYVLLQDFG